MSGLPPGIVSARWPKAALPFQGAEYRSSSPTPRPTPFTAARSPHGLSNGILGIVSQDTHRQALFDIGPFMVELFTAAGFASGPRTWSKSGSGCHQPGGSPRRHTLNELCVCRARTPWADLQPCGCSPTLQHDGLTAFATRSVRIAPIPGAKPSDRTLRLVSGRQNQRVYFSEPPSSTDKRLSPHPALPAQHMMAG